MEEVHAGTLFLWIAVILFTARFALLIERWGQSPVLGELLIGIILGNLTLVGINIFQPIAENEIIRFFAEFGVVILLFQVGLESNIAEMRRVGVRALLVACIGVAVPFALGTYLVGPLILPGLSSNAYLFLGATLTATSVGITARVFKDLNILNSAEAKIVLGAAVIDDVLGLIILAVVSAIATAGTFSWIDIGWISLKALVFLVGAILIGQAIAPALGRFLSAIHNGSGMKFTLAIVFGLICASLAGAIGLAPIVGAFAAGLVLDPVHFRHFRDPQIVEDIRERLAGTPEEVKQPLNEVIEHHAKRHVEDLIEPLGHLFIPLFFVLTGMSVRLETLFDVRVLIIALAITTVAFVGKVVSGLAAGKVSKSIVGWGMVPRGEVGLIFAATGQQLGVVTDELFSVVIIVVLLSTLLTPPILTYLIRRNQPQIEASLSQEAHT